MPSIAQCNNFVTSKIATPQGNRLSQVAYP